MPCILKKIFYFLSYWTGIIPFFYFLNRKKQLVLNFHHVLPDNEVYDNLLYGYSHKLSVFEKQIEIIEKKFKTGLHFNTNEAVITFDDGAKNVYRYALPVLERYRIKAHFFIIDYFISNPQELLWVDKWFLWLTFVPPGNYSIAGQKITLTEDNRAQVHIQLWDFLRENYFLKDQILNEMNTIYRFDNFSNFVKKNKYRFSFINSTEINILMSKGHKIGHHSYTHDVLSLLKKEDFLKQLDIQFENKIYNSNIFAIPFGLKKDISNEIFDAIIAKGSKYVLYNYYKRENFDYRKVYRINLPDIDNKYVIHAYLSRFHYFLKG